MADNLVKKIGWAYITHTVLPPNLLTIERYQELEDEGFGMLEDKSNPGRFDDSTSVVCPDGSVFTPQQIENYWNKKNGAIMYSSENLEDVKMHRVRIYYLGFKSV